MSPRSMARGWIWAGIGLVVLLLYLPLLPPLLFSLAPEHANEGGITLRWYAEMWRNPLLTGAMATSVEVGIIVAAATPLLSLVAAVAIRELRVPRLVLLLMLLPLFVPGVSMGLATALFFRVLDVSPSMVTISLVQILWALPFATLVVLTSMSTFDPVYLEAAYMSGANRWRAFRDIELPLIWPGISGAATFSLILSFNETIRTSIVQGPLNTVQTYIWSTYKQVGLSPTLYALMTLLIVITIGLVGVYLLKGMRRA
ncbi:MAG: ABC transporter permease subunit [Alphaproteobacteria bacterium]|nr:MAG: ABC transporter permease subunit [Alphaproteobacteria bacterium]